MFGGAKTNRADRLHVKSVTSEGYRHVTWYRLFFFALVSMLLIVGSTSGIFKRLGIYMPSSAHESLQSLTFYWASHFEAIMHRVKLLWLPALALPLSTCGVLGNETVVNRTFDVFDYVDPLIGTINGGGVYGFNTGTIADNETRSCFPWFNPSFW